MTEATNKKLADLRKPFPPEAIDQIPKGNAMLDYVGHAYVTERLLDVDPEWTWEPLGVTDEGNPAIKIHNGEASLWIKLTVCGVTRIGVGCERDTKNDLTKQLVSDAIRNASMRFGAALDLWKKHAPPEATAAPAKTSKPKSKAAAKTSGEGNQSDAWLDILANTGEWWDNRTDKKNPKAPDFKAKNTNGFWATADSYNGSPAPMALWLRDAPPGFLEALETGQKDYDTSLTDFVSANSVSEAAAKLEGMVEEYDDDTEPF